MSQMVMWLTSVNPKWWFQKGTVTFIAKKTRLERLEFKRVRVIKKLFLNDLPLIYLLTIVIFQLCLPQDKQAAHIVEWNS